MQTISDHRHGGGRALTLAFLAAVIEGFDLQAAGVAAPKLVPAFALTPQQVGLFFSAATFGLIFGALAGGRIADAWGRRAGLVISLVTFGVFSIATAYAASFEQLVAMRFLTGVGLGGALPNLVNIAAESAQPKDRGKAVAIMYAGVPLGGAIASGVSILGLHGGDWQTIFLVGGVMPLVLAPFIHGLLPPLAVVKDQVASAGNALAKVFAPGTLMTTVTLWLSFFLGLVVVYLLLNWMPQLLVSRGLERSEASTVQILFNIGGVLGSLVGGRMLDRPRPAIPVALCFAAAGAALLMLAMLPANLGLMLLGGALVGGAILCVQAILYGVAPQCYPFEIRGTGVGTAVAVGRLGSIVGPLLAGGLVAAGFTPSNVMMSLVPITLAAGLTTVVLLVRRRAAAPAPA
ncbi:3-(3-hydroxy-phenyl)propionate transporter MhpT [Paracoccus versutus]|uniref:AAHS family 3-hydroxyphenylpropionic acid transporter n=1 Tax=Paracoccus versutus TaxID=34007 RepID=A0AAQ0HGV3_PARVE|nr:3-(3-hydroxy-phenyl)propionate transporter MhpT [Paracoccus versutus]REG45935.1 AAHS family 3-hydroxyphenylpropionic acid transporter [Paracoccus versutus]WEJ77622.1 3-(3-hydroxy-phenyl)propionate transporter MhpT [Paracoccus versutus]